MVGGRGSSSLTLVEGDYYKVVWDGNEYTCQAFTDSNNAVIIGDLSFDTYPFAIASAEPFQVVSSNSNAGEHTFSVTALTINKKGLDWNLLPDLYIQDPNNNDYNHKMAFKEFIESTLKRLDNDTDVYITDSPIEESTSNPDI